MGILVFLLLSVPLFAIIGIISVIRALFGKSDMSESVESSREKFLKTSISEFSKILDNNPKITLNEQRDIYLKEFNEKFISPSEVVVIANMSQAASGSILHQDIGSLGSRWYATNSINLLLYIGAFLIVASASIFVGFQWETISGVAKALLLLLLAIAFFLSGLWFYQIPKIKSAGATFLAIGALLIPFCGVAWYNFVIGPAGGDARFVWLLTSFFSLSIYLLLAYYLKNSFYMYVAVLASFSSTLSLVHVINLGGSFYILTSILTSFFLLMTSIVLKNSRDEDTFIGKPLALSAQITMPISILYGICVAAMEGRIFTFEAALSILLGASFYLLAYLFLKKNWMLLASLMLFPFSFVLLSKWLGFADTTILYLLPVFCFVYLVLSYLQKRNKEIELSNVSIILAFLIIILAFLASFSLSFDHGVPTVLLACIAVVVGCGAMFVRKNIDLLQFATVFVSMGLFFAAKDIFYLFTDHSYLLSYAYMLLGIGFFVAAVRYKNSEMKVMQLGIASGLFLSLGFIFVLTFPGFLLLTCLVLSTIVLLASRIFASDELLYSGITLVYITSYTLLRYLHIDIAFYPIFFAGVSYVMYFLSTSLPVRKRMPYRASSLASALVTSALFGVISIGSKGESMHLLERNTLIMAYSTVIFFTIDAYREKLISMKYFSSGIAMATCLWQIHFLGVSQLQAYSIPLGVYLLIIGYTRRLFNDKANEDILYLCGMFVVLFPAWIQSYGKNGFAYALFLGVLGLMFVGVGISLRYKKFIYAGYAALVLAVLSQVAVYLYSLPRWAITGGAGVLVLAIAIYLLLKRKEA